jgi:IS5 family transposase
VLPVIEYCEALSLSQVQKLPWNIKLAVQQIRNKGLQYLSDVDYWLKNGKMKAGKMMAFHLNEVACFNKGKLGKPLEFGRAFQLGRLAGNFLIVGKCRSVRMDDKKIG